MTDLLKFSRSQARVENYQRLIGELRTRTMSRDEICEFLGYSPSGARKYIRDLHDSGVIVAVDRIKLLAHSDGQGVYSLAAEPVVTAYLHNLAEAVGKFGPKGSRRTNLEIAQCDPTRHVHLMQDDAHFAVRLPRKPVLADPFHLHRDFFKPAADELPASQPVVPLRARSDCFPEPAAIRFQLEPA